MPTIACIAVAARSRAAPASRRAATGSAAIAASTAATSAPVTSSISRSQSASPTSRYICPFRVSVGCRRWTAGVPFAIAMIGECISKLATAAARAYTAAASAVSQ